MIKEKCVIYCSVSSKSQLEGWGLWSQESSCSRHAEINWFEVIKVFQDKWISGGLKEREWIDKLFDFVKKYNTKNTEKISIFLTDDIDRVARDIWIHISLKTSMLLLWMRLEFVKQNFDNTPVWWYMEWMMALSAQLYREQNKERVIARQEARLLDWYRPRYSPIWYKTEKSPSWWKILIIEEDIAPIIKEALEWYANWLFLKQSEIAEFFERKWFEFKKRKKSRINWDIKKVHTSAVSRMLKNILYAGYIKYDYISRNKDGTIKKNRKIPLTEWKHEWIISLDTYYKIQKRMNSKKQPTKWWMKMINESFPLRWHICCECCWLPLSSGISKGNWWKVPYYTFNKKCPLKWWLNAGKVHIAFEKQIENINLDDKFIKFIKIILTEERDKRQKDLNLDKATVKKNISKIDKEVEKYLDLVVWTKSDVVRKRYEAKIEELELKKQEMIIFLEKDTDTDFPELFDLALKILKNPLKIRKTGTIEQKRLFLNIGFRSKILIQKNDKVFWTMPFSRLFLLNQCKSNDKCVKLEMTGIEPVSKRHYIGRLLS